ncbi:ring-cleaving dioxygenase [Halobacteriales archaeon QS_5_70_17]|nr:MAG: ring-cleaving dioxygenase [Halobacteriales archaeon QS_5_70_17]
MTPDSRPEPAVPGIHHVTAIAGDPRKNRAFYTGTLGLRFVKRTVNFDDPGTYHLYYGDEVGTPGTALTFFPFEGARQGRVGAGQTGATAFVIPEGAIDYWIDRFDERGVDREDPIERFGERVLPFRDPDSQPLELIEGATDEAVRPWTEEVPEASAIRGFHGVTLLSGDVEATARVLETMGYEQRGEEGDRTRYRAPGDRAAVVDLAGADRGVQGAGTVHHVAFRTADGESQQAWRERLTDAGMRVTEVKDRRYFRSVYFREPGGVLFEIATEGPGFTRDEGLDDLGEELKLPPWLENDREAIAADLPAIGDADPEAEVTGR